jgi:hypothetical protein
LIVNANQFTQKETIISNVTKKSAMIPLGSLKVGQSGVIIHNFGQGKSSILTNAIVKSSTKNSSEILFDNSIVLKQPAIPTTNRLPSNGDKFILNHLYNTSLLIAPNYETVIEIQTKYPKINFIDIDVFGAYLKMNNIPVPKKEDFITFSKHNNIGSVYISVNNTLHIVDVLSFKVLNSEVLTIEDNATQSPFFTNVRDIKTPFFSWFVKEKIDDYHKYYTNLLGISNDRK